MIRKFIYISTLLFFCSCGGFVEDGIEVDYEESAASLSISPISISNGAENDVVSLKISAESSFDIKSCIIKTSAEGKNGSGFNVRDEEFDDPFADHNFGTVRPGIKKFEVRYDYIIPAETNRSRISVVIIDESGKAEAEQTIEVVPSFTYHEQVTSYAKNAIFHDAISAVEGASYEDIKTNYSTISAENVEVQKKIDIVFYYDADAKNAVITSPASGRLDIELSVENKTLFRRLDLDNSTDLSTISAGELEEITSQANIQGDGREAIDRVKVGDVIGFIADLNAENSLSKGILKVEALHPTSVAQYEGTAFAINCSIIIQE